MNINPKTSPTEKGTQPNSIRRKREIYGYIPLE